MAIGISSAPAPPCPTTKRTSSQTKLAQASNPQPSNTNPMEHARLILDDPADGAWNMSVDQALLETADSTGLITLRFYRWSEPTLSLGYFQSFKDRIEHPPSANCKLVRRKTGGGAILHHHELTYSLCVPRENRWSSKNTDLYQLVHHEIVKAFGEFGIKTQLYADSLEPSENAQAGQDIDPKNYMCFKRRSSGDIVLNAHKIVGSAQRRNKNSLLQHGSILLQTSPYAPEIKGIGELANRGLKMPELPEKLATGILLALNCQGERQTLSDNENEIAKRIYSSQFNTDRWNQNR